MAVAEDRLVARHRAKTRAAIHGQTTLSGRESHAHRPENAGASKA